MPSGPLGLFTGFVTTIEHPGATSLVAFELAGLDGVALQAMVPAASEPVIGEAHDDQDGILLCLTDTSDLIGSDRLVTSSS